MSSAKKREFTGKHMLITMVVGFGIVVAVNLFMASLAVGGFHGIVVENSYVASQKFNDWLDEADRMRALGWQARATREESGRIIIASEGVPASAFVTATLRRPIGEQEIVDLTFAPLGDGRYQSTQSVSDGRWTIRLAIQANGESWAGESEVR